MTTEQSKFVRLIYLTYCLSTAD